MEPIACQVDEADGTTMDSIITNWTGLVLGAFQKIVFASKASRPEPCD